MIDVDEAKAKGATTQGREAGFPTRTRGQFQARYPGHHVSEKSYISISHPL
jgi:hypothetical protein